MIIFVIPVLCVLFSPGYPKDTKAFDYHDMLQDVKNSNQGDQTIQAIQANFNDQNPKNIDPKPCSRRSNSESTSSRRQWIPPFSQITKTKELAESPMLPNLKQTLRSNNDLKLKPSNIDDYQDFFTNLPSTIIKTSRNSLAINNTPLDFGEEYVHEKLPVKGVREPGIPGYEDNFAPSSAFDIDLPNDLYPAPIQSRNVYPSEDPIPKQVIRSEHLLSESQYFQTEPEPESKIPSNNQVLRSATTSKCSDNNNPSDLHSRRSMSSYNDDDSYSASDRLNSDPPRNINDPYDQSRIERRNENEKALSSVLHSEQILNKADNDQKEKSLSNSEKTKTTPFKSLVRSGRPEFNEARREMIEPTRGVSNIGQSALVLMQSERICYACSTANNPNCWVPDRRTTVKYCRKGNNACITKTFGSGSTFTLIRDCGSSCDESDMGGIMPKYKSCSMCHSELCNSAYSINGQSILFALILTAFIKYLN